MQEILAHGILLSLVVPILMGVWYWRGLSLGFRALVLGLVGYFVVMFYSMLPIWVEQLRTSNNLYLVYLISIVYEMGFVAFFALSLPKGNVRKPIIWFLGLLGATFVIIDAFFISGYTNPSKYGVPAYTIISLAIALLFFEYLLKQSKGSLLTNGFFWVVLSKTMGTTISLAWDFFKANIYTSLPNLFAPLSTISFAVFIVFNLLYAIGIGKHRTVSKT